MNIPEKTQQLIDTLLRERDEARDQVAHLLLEKAEAAVAFRDEIHRLTLERDEARKRLSEFALDKIAELDREIGIDEIGERR